MDFTLDIYTNLNLKYQNKFNFYFSKCINQIVFNQTLAITTISFKDAVIYAESIDYLKRQYHIFNRDGHQEIFERIHMLAGFYAGAILLRYEYPSMVITNTKDIFLKRLKRNKKMLTEEGSSDQSEQKTQSKQIELHTNTFLSSVNSSQLSKKTTQLQNDQLNKSNHQQSFDWDVHDIHNVSNRDVEDQSQNLNESFAEKLLRLSKRVSLTDLAGKETIELNLQPNQSQICHLLCDFDQINQEQTIKNYQKLRKKHKQNYINFGNQYPEREQINIHQQRKKISSILLRDSQYISNLINEEIYHQRQQKKYNEILTKRAKQMKFSEIYDSHNEPYRNKMYSEYEINNHNKNRAKMSSIYDMRRSNLPSSINGQHTPRTINSKFNQDYHFINYKQQKNETDRNFTKQPVQRHYNVQFKLPSPEPNDMRSTLHRHRSNNVIGHARESQFITRPQEKFIKGNINKKLSYENVKYIHNINNIMTESVPYTGYQHNEKYNTSNNRYDNERMESQQNYPSPKFKQVKEQRGYENYDDYNNYEQNSFHPPLLSHRVQKSPSIGLITNKNPVNLNNNYHYDNHNVGYNSNKIGEVNIQQEYFNQKVEKKKKIREKAAQLLHRVRSQEYLAGKMTTAAGYVHSGNRAY